MKLPSLDGGSWVDLFGIVIILRLLAVFAHFPPLTLAEAGIWGTTIASFAASNIGGPKQS
jgi:hypothetical protein